VWCEQTLIDSNHSVPPGSFIAIIIMIYYASWQHKLKTRTHKTTAGNDYKKANIHIHMLSHGTTDILQNYSIQLGGSVDEWLACWTQVQMGLGSNRSRDAVG